jgi:hypothetical protein
VSFQEGGSKWLLEFLSNEYVKIPAKKRIFLVWFENFEALFPSNPAISQANMLRKPITQKTSLPSATGILQKIGRTVLKVKNGGKFNPK